MADVIKIKRDGERGYKFIAAENFNPAVHELFDAPAKAAPKSEPVKPAPKAKKGAK